MKVDIENMIQQIVEKSGKSKEQIQAEINEEIERRKKYEENAADAWERNWERI